MLTIDFVGANIVVEDFVGGEEFKKNSMTIVDGIRPQPFNLPFRGCVFSRLSNASALKTRSLSVARC